MTRTPAQRRWLAVCGTGAVFAALLALQACRRIESPGPVNQEEEEKKGQPGPAADGKSWPLFGGSPARNLVNLTDKNIPTEWDIDEKEPKNVLWSVDLGSKAYGGPIVSGGRIFIGTNNDNPRDPNVKGDKGVLMCFDVKTGRFLWQVTHDKLDAGRVNDWPHEGICSSPVVEGDLLYYVSNRCEVICARTKDGSEVWKLDMIGKLKVFPHNLATCSPLIAGDTLFIITSNGVDEDHLNVPNPEAPSFLAIDKKSGNVKWQNNSPSVNLVEARKTDPKATIKGLVNKGLVLMHGQWSNPVYAEAGGQAQIIFPGGDGWLRSFNPANGELLWKFDCNPKNSVYELGGKGTRSDFVCTPVVSEGKLYIGTGQDPEHNKGVGHLWCIDITKKPDNPEKDLSPKKGDEKLQTFDPKDPANKDSGMVWHFGGFAPPGSPRPYVYGRTLSTVCVHDGLVYASEYDGILHCLDANTGQEHWNHDMRADCWSSPYWVDGKVYLGNEKGQILVFEHGKTKKLLSTVDMDGLVRATPVVVNGTMYVIQENPTKMFAIAAGAKYTAPPK
jgi:outer membrane protein assembly factor BamB